MRGSRAEKQDSLTEHARDTGTNLALPKHPTTQEGKRLTNVQLENAVRNFDHRALSQEAQFAIEKSVWLYYQRKENRADLLERFLSAGATLEVSMKYLTADAEKGRQRRAWEKKGVEKAYGSLQERNARAAKWQDMINSEARRFPKESFRKLAARIAAQADFSERTIRRYTKNPRAKGA
jgi:oligoribonuclease NrnB/cAMP/cGMP phosphodiesterase (DHH superfamily)